MTEAFLPQVNGVTNSVLRLLEFCRSQGHQVLVIAPESENAPKEYCGYKIKHVPSIDMKKLIPMGLPQRTLEPFIEGFAPDVIHLASPIFLGHYVARLAKKAGIPTVSVYQTDIAGFARHYGLTIAHATLKRWVARIHSTTDLTLAPSSWACRDLENSGVKNVKLWQRGVNIENFQPSKFDADFRSELLTTRGRKPSPKYLVGYVGRLANEKRVSDLEVIDRHPDFQLVIVGDGPARAKLENDLPNAIFVGYQSGADLARYVAALDVFVHTGGPTDLIEHGKTGLLIDTANSHELLDSVFTLAEHPARDLMEEAARKSVEHRTWDQINEELIKRYRETIRVVESQKDLVA